MSLVLMKHYKLMLAIRCYFKLHPIYEEVCLFIYFFIYLATMLTKVKDIANCLSA